MEALLIAPVLGPILIFFMRIADVSLATIRMLLILRNQKVLAPIIGFFEVLIWIFAAGVAIQHLESPLHLLGYAGGFAAGNWVGLWLEGKMALGLAALQVFTPSHGSEVAETLREIGHGVTQFTGKGKNGPVEVVYSVVKRKDAREAMSVVHALDKDAFITVGDVSAIQHGWMFPKRRK
ncbi:MAG: DUF2179 domain-containing protein [Gemmatimonadota bacterium]